MFETGLGLMLTGAPDSMKRAAAALKCLMYTKVVDDNRTGPGPRGHYAYVLYVSGLDATVAFTETGEVYMSEGKLIDAKILSDIYKMRWGGARVRQLRNKPSQATLVGMCVRYRYMPHRMDHPSSPNRFDAICIGPSMHGVMQVDGNTFVFSAPADMDLYTIYAAVLTRQAEAYKIDLHFNIG